MYTMLGLCLPLFFHALFPIEGVCNEVMFCLIALVSCCLDDEKETRISGWNEFDCIKSVQLLYRVSCIRAQWLVKMETLDNFNGK